MMRVREGSLADRYMKACDFIDDTKKGNALAAAVISLLFVGLFIYGLHCTHPLV